MFNKKLIPLVIVGIIVLFVIAFLVVPSIEKKDNSLIESGGLLRGANIEEEDILLPEGLTLDENPIGETSPPSDPIFTPMPGDFTKIVEDNFTDSENGIKLTPVHQNSFTAKYYDDGFTLYIQEPMVTGYVTKRLITNNILIDVTTNYIAGTTSNFYGIITRYTDSDNFYYFMISNTGYYAIGKKVNGTITSLLPAETMQTSAIHTDKEEPNHLHVLNDNDQFFLYINDELVSSVEDTDLVGYGVGFAVISGDTKGTSVSFDDLIIYDFARK